MAPPLKRLRTLELLDSSQPTVDDNVKLPRHLSSRKLTVVCYSSESVTFVVVRKGASRKIVTVKKNNNLNERMTRYSRNCFTEGCKETCDINLFRS